jgi:hypothetical protein
MAFDEPYDVNSGKKTSKAYEFGISAMNCQNPYGNSSSIINYQNFRSFY